MITANMNLYGANKEVLTDETRPQQTRLKSALTPLEAIYDYCVIDNAPVYRNLCEEVTRKYYGEEIQILHAHGGEKHEVVKTYTNN